jgi:hypothetical protein
MKYQSTIPETYQPPAPRRVKSKKVVISRSDGVKTKKILALAINTNAAPCEIAAATNTSTALVSQVFKRYGIESKHLESFKKHRADVYAGISEKIALKLSDGIPNVKISNARDVREATYALGILHEKESLERGKPTAIVDIRSLVLSAEIQEKELTERLEAETAQLLSKKGDTNDIVDL